MHARVKSSMNGSHTFTAAGDRNGLRMRRYSDCSGGSISMNPPRVGTALGDRDALVAVALAVGVVVVRQEVGALRDRAQDLVPGDDPEPVVVGAPHHRALLTQLVGLRRVGLPVLGVVLVELDDHALVGCHRTPRVLVGDVRAQYGRTRRAHHRPGSTQPLIDGQLDVSASRAARAARHFLQS